MDSGKIEFRRKRRLKKLVLTFLSYKTSWEGVQMTLIRTTAAEKLSKNRIKSKNWSNFKTRARTNLEHQNHQTDNLKMKVMNCRQ